MTVRRIAPFVAALALATVVAGCGSDEASAPSSTQVGSGSTDGSGGETGGASEGEGEGEGAGAVEVVGVTATTAAEPIVLLAQPGDDGHVWLAERAGTVRRLAVADDGTLEPVGDVLLDVSDLTTTDVERGLLGMAFSPEGDELYLSYTDTDGNSRVVRHAVDATTVAAEAEPIFAIDQPYPNHNGGGIAFGPDGKLWFGLGDGGSADDPENNAQDPTTELGKIIRIDVETGETEIVISGARNPWRWAFDTDGSLWVADVGQNQWEEINHLPAEEIDGANLGWSGYEGTHEYLEGDGRRPDDPVVPVFEYEHQDGNCSITGGFPYRGTAIPALEGAFVFADYCIGRVRAIVLDDDGGLARELDLGIDVEQPISFGQDAAGELYVLSGTGAVVRIAPAG